MRSDNYYDGKRFYSMETLSINGKFEVYSSSSWIGLGWMIFKVRCYHLLKYGKWKD